MSDAKPAKRKWVRWLIWGAASVVVLLLAAVAGLLLYFNDAYFQARLKETVRAELERDLEVRALHISFWNGSAVLEGVRLLNTDPVFRDKDTLRVERASASVGLWGLVWSGGKKLEGVRIEVDKPEVFIERIGVWPNEISNVDDLIRKLTAGPPGVWPKQTGLQALSATVAVRGGSVLYRDSDEKVGASRIKDFALDARQAALGQPLDVKLSFALATPEAEREGAASLDGRCLWLQADGSINPAAFQDLLLSADLKELDIAQFGRHLRLSAGLLGGKYDGTLGQPVSGLLKLEAPALDRARLTASFETDGAMAVWQGGKRVAGNFPARIAVDAQGGFAGGGWQAGPTRASVVLAATREALAGPGAAKMLELGASAAPAEGGATTYSLSLNGRLDDLFATDVGEVLELKGRIGGALGMKAEASRDASGRMKAEGKLGLSQGYVIVDGARQPTVLEMGFSGNVLPDAQGRPERADFTFTANADSFYVRSLRPVVITSLSEPRNLAAEARLQLHVGGREFWRQFQPLLKVAGMAAPLAEELDGELQVTGTAGKVQIQLDSTLQQQSADPRPVRLVAKADYDGGALVDAPTQPYLTFDAQVRTADKSLSFQLAGTATRGREKHVVDLPSFQALGDLKAFSALNKRFGAYVRVFLGPEYAVSGFIKQTGKSQFVQTLAPDGQATGTELSLNTDLQLAGFELRGPPLVEKGTPLSWTESAATLQLGMNLKDAGGSQTLSLQPVKLHATGWEVEGEMAEADLAKLKAARGQSATPVKLWLEALPAATLYARVSAAVLKQLQVLGALPYEPLAVGDLTLKAQHDPKTRKAKVEALEFAGPSLQVKLAPTEIDTAALAPVAGAKTLSFAQLVPALPALALDATAKAEILLGLQKKLGLPEEPLAPGQLTLRVEYDPKTRRAAIPSFTFAGPDVDLKASAAAVDLPALAALADQPNTRLSQWLQAAPSRTVEATVKAPALQRLQRLKLLPDEPLLVGDWTVRGAADSAARQIRVETLIFTARAGKLTLSGLCLSTDKLGALLDNPRPDAAAYAQVLPDFELRLERFKPQVSGTLHAALWDRKLLPEKSALSGTLNLSARYNQAADRLTVEQAEYERDARASVPNAPLLALALSGEIAGVRGLIAKPPEDAAKILACFDKGLSVKKLTAEPSELLAYLKWKGIAVSVAQDFEDKVCRPQGLLSVQDLVVRPAGAPGVFDVVFSTQAPLHYHPRTGPGLPPAAEPQLGLLGPLSFDAGAPLRLNLNPGQYAFQGTLNLDAAHIRYLASKQFFAYDKPPGTPCKLRFDMSLGDGSVVKSTVVELKGGPLEAALSGLLYDQGKDLMRWQVDVPAVDLARFAGVGEPLPPDFQFGGTLGKLRVSYNGAASAFPKALAVSVGATEVRLAGTVPGKNVSLAVTGDLGLEPGRLASNGLQVALEYEKAGPQKLQLSLQGVPRKAGGSIGEALLKERGLPLAVKANAQAGALDLNAIMSGLAALLSLFPDEASSERPQYEGVSELRAEFSGSAEKVVAGGTELNNVQVPSIVLDGRKLALKDVTAKLHGDGSIALREGAYDLLNDAHYEALELANLDLQKLTAVPGQPADKVQQRILGRVSGNGQVRGQGFSETARKTWQGTITLQVDALTVQTKDPGLGVFRMAAGVFKLAGGVLKPVTEMIRPVTQIAGTVLKPFASALGGLFGGGQAADADLAAAADFLAGLFYEEGGSGGGLPFGALMGKRSWYGMEFETSRLAVNLRQGVARVEPGSLVGRGRSAGLQIDLAGGIGVSSDTYQPDFTFWLAKLTPKSQQVLKLGQLEAADRERILGRFAKHELMPIVLTGAISDPSVGKTKIIKDYSAVTNEIEELIRGKATAGQPQPQPGTQKQPGTTTPPEKKKTSPWDLIPQK